MIADLVEAAQTGGRLVTLAALRDRLAGDIDRTSSARDVAPLAQRLMDVLAQIDELEAGRPSEKATGLSEFEKRLRDREQGAKAPRRAKSS